MPCQSGGETRARAIFFEKLRLHLPDHPVNQGDRAGCRDDRRGRDRGHGEHDEGNAMGYERHA